MLDFRFLEFETFSFSRECSCYTIGSSEFDHVRPLSYEGVSLFLACFDLNDLHSFENLSTKVSAAFIIFFWKSFIFYKKKLMNLLYQVKHTLVISITFFKAKNIAE